MIKENDKKNRELIMQTISRAVKRKCEELEISETKAAEAAGIHKSTFSRISRAVGFPDADTLAKLAEWLNIPIHRLMTLGNENEPVIYSPNEPVPEIVHAHLIRDENLDEKDAQILSEIFRAAYEQFSGR